MSYDFYFLSAVVLFCLALRAGLKHVQATRVTVRDPWSYRDHEADRRRAFLQTSQQLAVRCHAQVEARRRAIDQSRRIH